MSGGKKKILSVIAFILALAVFIVSALWLGRYYLEKKANESLPSSKDISSGITYNEKKEVEVPVDFEELQKENKDIYAWITIPDKENSGENIIDYPILQSSEEDGRSYYLTHNVDREYSSHGSIYTQNYNSKDFNDYNTVIYGHNMLDKTMFGKLKNYRDSSFFKTNNVIYIYMPGRILKYKIFAAYVFDDRHILMSFDFNDEDSRRMYLDTVYSKRSLSSNFNEKITVDTDDKIITLSTCTSRDEERYLVQGVLVYDSDTQ